MVKYIDSKKAVEMIKDPLNTQTVYAQLKFVFTDGTTQFTPLEPLDKYMLYAHIHTIVFLREFPYAKIRFANLKRMSIEYCIYTRKWSN